MSYVIYNYLTHKMKRSISTAFLIVVCSLMAHAQTFVQVSALPAISRELPVRQDDVRLLPDSGRVMPLTADSLASSGGEYPREEEFTIYPNPSTAISSICIFPLKTDHNSR
jgi:hypothetical protein